MRTRKLVYSGVLIAIGILLPQIFHLAGKLSGSIFLPMHIGILIAGFIVGPYHGALVGLIVPFLSSAITQMPQPPMLYFMVFELVAYGYFTGLFYHKFKKGKLVSLISSMIAGRIVYIIVAVIAGKLFDLPYAFLGAAAIIEKFSISILGIIIQIIIVPTIVLAVEKGGLSLCSSRNS